MVRMTLKRICSLNESVRLKCFWRCVPIFWQSWCGMRSLTYLSCIPPRLYYECLNMHHSTFIELLSQARYVKWKLKDSSTKTKFTMINKLGLLAICYFSIKFDFPILRSPRFLLHSCTTLNSSVASPNLFWMH